MPNNVPSIQKNNLHPNNKHIAGYDFKTLTRHLPLLESFLLVKHNRTTLDFANPQAVLALNQALLISDYRIKFWQIPPNYLCPPVPGRVDYIHYLANLLEAAFNKSAPNSQEKLNHSNIKVVDIGTGASCIYPILGQRCYQWRFIASDIDPVSINNAKLIIQANPGLAKKITTVLQPNKNSFFNDVIKEGQRIDLTLCNPPFHESLAQAMSANTRKRTNLAKSSLKNNADTSASSTRNSKVQSSSKADLNFGGQQAELHCEGGELSFIKQMIDESQTFGQQVLFFTCLVSKSAHLKALKQHLQQVKADDVQIIEMSQGNKISRFIAWSFLSSAQRSAWFQK